MLKRRLIDITRRDADILSEKWLREVLESPLTPTYKTIPTPKLLERAKTMFLQMEQWLEPDNKDHDVRDYYSKIGQKSFKDGFGLEEVVVAIQLTKKVLWDYAVSKGLPTSSFELYSALDLNNQVVYYFDYAVFHFVCGYIEAETGKK